MSQFILTITLGNDAMMNGNDLYGPLKNLADKLSWYDNLKDCQGTIKDKNGNTVGSWKVS